MTSHRRLRFVFWNCMLFVVGSGCVTPPQPLESGVYWSAKLSAPEFEQALTQYQFQSVLNLDGFQPDQPWYQEYRQLCDRRQVKWDDTRLIPEHNTSTEIESLLLKLSRLDPPILLTSNESRQRAAFAASMYRLFILHEPAGQASQPLRQTANWPGQPQSQVQLLRAWQDQSPLTPATQMAAVLPELWLHLPTPADRYRFAKSSNAVEYRSVATPTSDLPPLDLPQERVGTPDYAPTLRRWLVRGGLGLAKSLSLGQQGLARSHWPGDYQVATGLWEPYSLIPTHPDQPQLSLAASNPTWHHQPVEPPTQHQRDLQTPSLFSRSDSAQSVRETTPAAPRQFATAARSRLTQFRRPPATELPEPALLDPIQPNLNPTETQTPTRPPNTPAPTTPLSKSPAFTPQPPSESQPAADKRRRWFFRPFQSAKIENRVDPERKPAVQLNSKALPEPDFN